MERKRHALASSIGGKAVMALTGLLLLGFVVVHMLGNLQVYAGPAQLNGYAQKLKDLGPLLWVLRIGLLAVFVAHVAAAARVARQNRAARPVAYRSAAAQVTTPAARTMLLTGFVVLAFVVYHLLHFTFGTTNPGDFARHTADGHHDVYAMVVLGFRRWPVTIAYVVAQLGLAFHLSHGASSAFQTLGVTHPRLAWLKSCFGPAIAALIFVGNVSIPVSILAGWVTLPAGGPS